MCLVPSDYMLWMRLELAEMLIEKLADHNTNDALPTKAFHNVWPNLDDNIQKSVCNSETVFPNPVSCRPLSWFLHEAYSD